MHCMRPTTKKTKDAGVTLAHLSHAEWGALCRHVTNVVKKKKGASHRCEWGQDVRIARV